MALTTTTSSWSPLYPPTQTLVASSALSRRFDEGEINQIVRKLFDNEINVELDICDSHSECSICLELCETNGGKIKCCHNTYHKDCIMKWVKAGNNTCPTCRGIIH